MVLQTMHPSAGPLLQPGEVCNSTWERPYPNQDRSTATATACSKGVFLPCAAYVSHSSPPSACLRGLDPAKHRACCAVHPTLWTLHRAESTYTWLGLVHQVLGPVLSLLHSARVLLSGHQPCGISA